MSAVDAGILEAWLASTDDGAIAVDASGCVILHNPAASRVTGLVPGAGVGRPWREVLRLDPLVADALWQARDEGRTARAVGEVLCAQGNLRTVELSSTPWTDRGGRTGLLLLIRDLAVLCRQRSGPEGREGYGSMVGAHPSMMAVYDLIEAVAPSDATVLIEGEPGTGKELVAQLLHARSGRAERPLMTVDCAALASAALAAELFGHARSPFGPGAAGPSVIGRVELAHSGTLLLDRVGEAALEIQARLLRLIDDGEIQREGESSARRVDVRVIAITSRPLERDVAEGRFSDRLWRRLRVVRIRVPPLRERLSDLPLLVDFFLARHGPAGCSAGAPALAALRAQSWPGNVRQLENAIRHALTLLPAAAPGAGHVIDPAMLPSTPARRRDGSAGEPPSRPPREDRRSLLLRALSSHGGNRAAAARSLGIGRATFYRWWREAGLA